MNKKTNNNYSLLLNSVDVSESQLKDYDLQTFNTLLLDHTTGNNILWGTDDYKRFKDDIDYSHDSEIKLELITGKKDGLIKPRILKTQIAQKNRSRDKAEVFTPAWICNAQNNLVDEAWFGYKNPFNYINSRDGHKYGLCPRTKDKNGNQHVIFPEGKTWQQYVLLNRMEVTCGEAPYLVNRYDSDSKTIRLRRNIKMRIGLLDRKMRVICENASSKEEWLSFTFQAYKHIYGFEWQGDNLLLARENLLLSFFDYYQYQFSEMPDLEDVRQIAEIISWNLWQMDGLTLQTIYSKKSTYKPNALFEEDNKDFCKIMDWDEQQIIYFASMVKN